MDLWTNFKWMVFGIEPPLSKITLDRLKEREKNRDYYPEQNPTPISLKCSYHPCRKKLGGLYYKCKYCEGKYCETHRLPEDHDCDEPKLPSSMKRGSNNNSHISSQSNLQSEAN